MKLIWMMCFLILLSRFTPTNEHSIKKRNIAQFGRMINMVTNVNAIKFNEYGSYCGFGGSGEVLDEIDRCCKKHDECYGYANSLCADIFDMSAYLLFYKWNFNGTHIKCENNDLCRQQICLCDKIAAHCFAENLADYNHHLRDLSFLGNLLQKLLKHIPVWG